MVLNVSKYAFDAIKYSNETISGNIRKVNYRTHKYFFTTDIWRGCDE